MKLSLRADFDNPVAFGHTLYRSGDGLTLNSYPRISAGCILIHGYHSTAAGAAASYATIQAAMSEVPMMELYWPGGELAMGFPIDVRRATDAGIRLRDILNGCLMDKAEVDIQTHSLGARVALEALNWPGLKIRHLILTAPAVEHECLVGEFSGVMENVASLNIFSSSNDPVLRKDFPLGSFGRTAMGLYGPSGPKEMWTEKLRVWDCSRVIQSHSGYRDAPEYYAAWRTILDGSAKAGVTVL